MLFPISDDDRGLKHIEWVTIVLLIANVAVFYYQMTNPDFTQGFSAIPKEITTGTDLVGETTISTQNQGEVTLKQTPGPTPIFLTIFSAMFMHGSLMHIGSNMLFLFIFGDNVENRFGSLRFILFYLVSGVVATLVHIMMDPQSVIPSLGASGAIAGILGAYLVMFPRNRVKALFFVRVITIPAWIVIGLWGILQVTSMVVTPARMGGGVAYGAHVGGLAAGLILGMVFRFLIEKEPDSIILREYQRDNRSKQLW